MASGSLTGKEDSSLWSERNSPLIPMLGESRRGQAARGSRTGFVSSVTYLRMRRRERKISNLENSDLGKQVSFMLHKKPFFDFLPYEIMRTFYRIRRVHLFNFNLKTTVKWGLGSCSVGIQFQFYKKKKSAEFLHNNVNILNTTELSLCKGQDGTFYVMCFFF